MIDLRDFQLEVLKLAKCFDQVCNQLGISYSLKAGSCLGAVRHGGFIPWDDDFDVVVSYSDFVVLKKFIDENRPDLLFLEPLSPRNKNFYGKIIMNCKEKFSQNIGASDVGLDPFVDVFFYGNFSEKKYLGYFQFIVSRLLIIWTWRDRKRLLKRKSFLVNLFTKIAALLPKHVINLLLGIYINNREEESNKIIDCLDGSGFSRGIFDRSLFTDTSRVTFEDSLFPIPVRQDLYLQKMYGNYMSIPDLKDRVPPHINEVV